MLNLKVLPQRRSALGPRKSSREIYSNNEEPFGVEKPTSEIVAESLVTNHLSVPKRIKRKMSSEGYVNPNIHLNGENLTLSSTPSSYVFINRKLTKGYGKFLDEKDFIERRNEEKTKIEKDLRKTGTIQNSTVMSKDVRKLLTSAVLYRSSKRSKSVFRTIESNACENQFANVNELHKQISNRILGNHLEDAHLFRKIQEENAPQTSRARESIQQTISQKLKQKGLTPSLRIDINDCLQKGLKTTKVQRSIGGPKSSSLTSLNKGKDKEYNFLEKAKWGKANSLNVLENARQRKTEDPGSLGSLESHQGTNFNSRSALPEVRIMNIRQNLSQKIQRSVEREENTPKEGKFRFTIRKGGIRNAENFQTTLYKNLKAYPKSQKLSNGSLTTRENTDSRSQIGSNSNLDGNNIIRDKTIEQINKLCEGVIKSTNKLGHRIKRQKMKLGKEFGRLDVQMEKLTYSNTISAWEKSIKQVAFLEQRSPFFNPLL